MAFDIATGALIRIDSSDSAEGVGWASASHPIGRFGYRSHSYAEWNAFIAEYMYTHGGKHPHRPPPNQFLKCDEVSVPDPLRRAVTNARLRLSVA